MGRRRNTTWGQGLSSHRSRGSGGARRAGVTGPLEGLEPRLMMAAQPVISEFMAKNTQTLADGNGNYGDWIELQNQGDAPAALAGWHLSDDATDPGKWTFPTTTLAAGAYLVVFADGSGVTDKAGDLHTNFSLSQSGETLVLSRPDLTPASEWNPDGTPFPDQLPDVSYGTGTVYHNTTLVAPGAAATAFVPKDGTLDAAQWAAVNYNDSAWAAGTTGVGYDTGAYEDNSVPPTLTGDWAADDLAGTLASGATVTSWTDEVKHAAATGSGKPLFVANDFGTHAGIAFNPADGNDSLRVKAAVNPMGGTDAFTVAVVFKSTGGGVGAADYWYNDAGIVDADQGSTTNDWGLSLASTGQVAAGMGGPDVSVYSPAGTNEANGAAHVAVYARSGTSYTLYVDGGPGVNGTCSGATRNVSDMVFGAIQTQTHFLTGDIAEVRTYSGAVSSATKANVLAQPLATKYGVATFAPASATTPNPSADWVADAVAPLGDGAAVPTWTSTAGGTTRNASAGSVATAPTVRTGQLNGHAVLHFAGASSDALRVAAAVNPMSGAGDFTVAVVFRTTTPGVGQEVGWDSNTGLVGGDLAGVTTNDWGVSFNGGGEVGAGIGNPDQTVYSTGLLADGQAHVAVYTRTGLNTALYVDGVADPFTGAAAAGARAVEDMVFGALQTNANYFTGDLAEVQVYNAALSSDQADQLAGTLSTKYGVVPYPSPYGPLIGLNLQSAMSGAATTAAVRVPFALPAGADPGAYTRLLLNVQYDDGFVAYLNGTEVARRNAPAGAITYTSVATAIRPESQALAAETIDLSAFRSLLLGNGATNVLAFRALNTSLTDPDLLLRPSLLASTTTPGVGYFTAPTPGAANTTPAYVGTVKAPTLSAPHGYYSAPFATTLADATPGATIYYTTDGSDPSPTNGTAIAPASAAATASGTVTVSASTPLRAAAFLDTYLPSTMTTVTYLFVSSVLTQANDAPPGAYWTTQVDPRVVNATQQFSVAQAITSIPTISLVLPGDDLFGATNGIYTHPTSEGSAWEREASAEYFDPNNPTDPGFTIEAGLRIQGGADRQANAPKKSFRLFFRSQYGASTLDYPMFGPADPQQSFDHLVIKAIHNYSWANPGGNPYAQSDYVRDQYARDMQLAMSGHASQGKWVQLFLNGQYWGLYNVVEEPDATWAAANYGGTKDDYDVVQASHSSFEVLDGSGTAYANLYTTMTADMADGAVSAAEYAAYDKLVDPKALIDYMLNVDYRGDQDAPVSFSTSTQPHNFYAYRDAATGGPFRFAIWDGEYSLADPNIDRTTIAGISNPSLLFQDLKTNPEFAQLAADETYRLFYNGGVVATDASGNNGRALYDAEAAKINVAVVGESARWGYAQRPAQPYTRDTDWVTEINNLNNNFFPNRAATVLAQLRAAPQFAMLAILPPTYKVNGSATRGGTVAAGTLLTLAEQNATTAGDAIYYTLDGSDPRLVGGGLSPAAKLYSAPFALTATETVTVRILNGTTWSPIDAVNFAVNAPATAANLAVTEVNYHPNDPTAAEAAANTTGVAWTGDDFEFIELTNTSAGPVDLTGAAFDLGVTLTLGNVTVPAGGRVVVVANPAAFAARYGTAATVVGTYTGRLSNSSATVELKSAAGAVIANFAYQDSWYPRTDGDGSTLEAVAPITGTTAGNVAAAWRASYEVNGTPGTAGSPVADVVVNEVVSAPAAGGQEAVELYNTTSAPVNVGGWFLSNAHTKLTLYTIPAGTVIAAGGYLVVTAAQFDNASSPTAFALNGTVGDQVFLTKPKAAGGTTAYAFADSAYFGTSAIGESFGRSSTGVGTIMYPQASVTLGAANSGPRVGPVTITELMYNPTGGTTNLQYVEVQNQTNAAVDVSGWQFSQGITYTFPAGTTLAPHEAVTLVHFALTDAASLAAFRTAYGLDASYRLLGPFTDKLAAKGEEVELVKPDAPRPDAPAYTPLILMDDVTFGVASPWPTTAVGQALSRLSNHTFAEPASNWAAAAPSPDAVAYGNAWFEGSAHATLTGGTTLDSLTETGTAAVTLVPGSPSNWLRTAGLSMAAGTKLDVGTGGLILDGVAPAAVYALLATAAANGAWTGPGITSAAAANDAARLTTVAAASNAAGTFATFFGQPLNAADVLVRYTYYGDANFDGVVNAVDYVRIDTGYLGHATGWQNGDYNGDGVVDGSDYTLMDGAFNLQPGTIASPAAVVAGGAVAKPTAAKPARGRPPASTDWWRPTPATAGSGTASNGPSLADAAADQAGGHRRDPADLLN